MDILKDIGVFFSKTLPHAISDFFSAAKTNGVRIAVGITEGVQAALKAGVVKDVALIIRAIFPNVKNIPTDLEAKLQVVVPKVLAVELEVQQLPADATEEQVEASAKDILDAFNAKDDKSKLYSTLAGSVYSLLRAYTGQGSSMTWIEVLNEVEQDFQLFKNEQANDQTEDA